MTDVNKVIKPQIFQIRIQQTYESGLIWIRILDHFWLSWRRFALSARSLVCDELCIYIYIYIYIYILYIRRKEWL